MGSLMAGWSSPFRDPNYVQFQRNKSLTREEIEEYWRSVHHREEEQQAGASNTGLVQVQADKRREESAVQTLQRSSSLPASGSVKQGVVNCSAKPDHAASILKTNCWWTSSNSAFLNEPPVTAMDGPSYKYASQYHVTRLAAASIK